ncbi:MAG: hypothetical protein ACE5F1_14520 [Planctomycetota bacterium]
MRTGGGLVLVGLLGLSSCVSFNWVRTSVSEPIPDRLWQSLEPGLSLSECLDLLGAPFRVLAGPGRTVALVYAWKESVDWGFSVSVPVRLGSASYRFTDQARDMHAVRLVFDQGWRLRETARGRLDDFLDVARKRRSLDFSSGQRLQR